MKKLALDLDALAVQSFETGADAHVRGTVLGHAPTRGAQYTCATCPDSCLNCPLTPTAEATCPC